MTSISTTISSLAASDPIVGNAVAYASKQSQLLSTLSGGSASASASLQNLLTAAGAQSLGNITVPPTATGSTSATTDTTSSATTDATTSAAASTPDFSGNSAVMIADNQSLQSSQLLASLTGVGGVFSGTA